MVEANVSNKRVSSSKVISRALYFFRHDSLFSDPVPGGKTMSLSLISQSYPEPLITW